jgi:hypothetical protein
MKRLIAPLAVAAVALTPGAALAHGKTTKVYKATFQYVGADGDYVTGGFGKAHLVDGKRNDKLSVHVRRLARKATYVFRLQQAPRGCTAGAPGGTDVPGWKYRRGGVLKTNRHGVANGKATSRSFTAKRSVEYFVGVYRTTATGAMDELVLCAKLTTRHHRHHKPHHPGKPHKPGKPHHPGKPHKPHHPPKADHPAKPGHPAKPDHPAKPEHPAPGPKGQDKPHGKSEAAPGHNKTHKA